uniref:Phosphate/phosphite/phosphonate ABC transporter substrate-binding protein n=1 Tax=candidate division CPR3 bacterium TaxID=2268181 RepID=A0A7V3J9Q3_UNCC3
MFLNLFGLGCEQNTDTPVVDFSKTISSEQAKKDFSDYTYLRVAIGSMISPSEAFLSYQKLLEYLGKRLGYRVQVIQRKTYGEINELLGKGEVDLGFICSGAYVAGKEKYGFEIIATPRVRGSHFYRSYLIVQRKSPYQRLEDLQGRVFAFVDPQSNTGYYVPRFWLKEIGESPDTFFKKTLYTHSHDSSILAVAKGVVDGAAVDSLVWEYYQTKKSPLALKTRIIKTSASFGIPPVVVSKHLDSKLKEQIRQVFFSFHLDPEGRNILKELMIDQFDPPQDRWYDSVREILSEFSKEK